MIHQFDMKLLDDIFVDFVYRVEKDDQMIY